MISVLSITGTLFLIISIGYLSLRWQFLNHDILNLLISYVLYFALPAVIFNALSNQVLSEIINLNYLNTIQIGVKGCVNEFEFYYR